MTAYERVEGGRVVERVVTIDGSNEDTRIGCMVMDKQGGWQLAGTPIEPESPEPQDPEPAAASENPAPAGPKPSAESAPPEDAPTKTTKRAPRESPKE